MRVPRREWHTYAAWAAFVTVLWAPALRCFFAQEDFYYLLRAEQLGWGAWLPAGPLARPLVYGGWMQLGRLLCGLDPVRWHLGNLAVHGAGTMLVALLFRRVGLSRRAVVLGQLCYGFAPLHFNTIIWVQNVHPALASSLGIAALYVALGPAARLRTALALVWCGLALASNEIAVALAPAVVALEWARGSTLVDAAKRHGVLVVLVGAYVLWRLAGHGGAATEAAHQQLYTLTVGPNVLGNLGRYGLVLASPVWFGWMLLHGRAWVFTGQWVGAVCLVATLVASWRMVRTHPEMRRPAVAGWIWLLAAVAPSVVLTSFYPYRGAFAAAGFAFLGAVWTQCVRPGAFLRRTLRGGLVVVGLASWWMLPRGDTLQIRQKQEVARLVIADLDAFLRTHPETAAVHIPTLVEHDGLGAAALYWGDGIRLWFPHIAWVPSRGAVTEPTVVFGVESGRLVPRAQWVPSP